MPSADPRARPESAAPLRAPDGPEGPKTPSRRRGHSPAHRSRSEISEPLCIACLLCVCLLFGRPARAGDKTDVVQLKNGDTLTCEIKKLDLGVMTIDADATGK